MSARTLVLGVYPARRLIYSDTPQTTTDEVEDNENNIHEHDARPDGY